MGKVNQNVITQGFSGQFGEDLVFRQIGNQTFFARKGKVKARASAPQQETRTRFMRATLYAMTMLQKPQTHMVYSLMAAANSLRSAYVAAIKDYMTEPEIESVNTRVYSGAVGSYITIVPRYAHKITDMEVTMVRVDGTVLETGMATPKELKWRYTATVTNSQVPGTKLILKSRDRQGKEVTVEKVII